MGGPSASSASPTSSLVSKLPQKDFLDLEIGSLFWTNECLQELIFVGGCPFLVRVLPGFLAQMKLMFNAVYEQLFSF